MRQELTGASIVALLALPFLGAVSCGDSDACDVPPCGDTTTSSGAAGPGGGGQGASGGVGAGGAGAMGGGGSGATAGNGGTGGVDPCDACTGATPHCNEDDECVACLDASHCGGDACKPDGTCSDFGTDLTACEGCDTDANCAAGHVCVEMVFPPSGGASNGWFCQPSSSGACGEATRPYSLLVAGMTTADGASTDVCTLATTTCQGLADHAEPKICTLNDECGVPGQTDGLCKLFGTLGVDPFLCTYPCTANEQCPAGLTCILGAGFNYCSQQ